MYTAYTCVDPHVEFCLKSTAVLQAALEPCTFPPQRSNTFNVIVFFPPWGGVCACDCLGTRDWYTTFLMVVRGLKVGPLQKGTQKEPYQLRLPRVQIGGRPLATIESQPGHLVPAGPSGRRSALSQPQQW